MADDKDQADPAEVEALRARVRELERALGEERSPAPESANADELPFAQYDLELLRWVIELVPVIVFAVDLQGVIRIAEGKGQAAIGVEPGTAVGKLASELFPDVPEIVEAVFRCLAGEDFTTTFDVRDRLMQARHIPWRNSQGEVVGVIGIAVDITERLRQGEALRESEKRFRSVVQSLPMGLYQYQLEDDGRLVLIGANPAADEILGVDNSKFLGKTIEENFPPLAETEIPERYRAAARDGAHWWTEQVDYEHGAIKGAFEVWAFQTAPGQMAALFTDITERKQAQEELRHYRDQLRELVVERTRALELAQEELVRKERLATLGQLTGTVSHELRNPLATIRSSVFSLGSALEKDDRSTVARALDLAERNIVRCDAIIEDLLSFTRVSKLSPQEVEIDRWLGEVLDELPPPEGVQLVRDLRSAQTLAVDPERLRRAVVNVLTNAAQAVQERREGGGQITVVCEVASGQLCIRFLDNGPGIPADVRDRIFEPLFSTKGFGVGLGLPTVRNIVQEHDGYVEVASTPGTGTAVTLWLPVPDLPVDDS